MQPYIPFLSHHIAPLREFLKSNQVFCWDNNTNTTFQKLKSFIAKPHNIHLQYYRWVPLKADFLGAWKSVRLKHYPAYPIIIISLIMQRNLATKIQAKWESSLTAVWLKRDPPRDIVPSANIAGAHAYYTKEASCLHLKVPNRCQDLVCQHQTRVASHHICL